MQDKIKITEKISTSPQSLDNAEILAITGDNELKELYEGAALMSGALTELPDFDTEKSLLLLHAKMQQRGSSERQGKGFGKRLTGGLSGRRAAVAAGIALIAAAAIAAICLTNAGTNEDSPSIESSTQTTTEVPETQTPRQDKLPYDDARLEQILDDVSERYNCRVEYINTASKESRYHITIPAEASLEEVVDMLNAFDEVRISIKDNTLTVE